MSGLEKNQKAFVDWLKARTKFQRNEVLEAYKLKDNKDLKTVTDAANEAWRSLEKFLKAFQCQRYLCIYYNSLVGKALNMNLLGPLKILLPPLPSSNNSEEKEYDNDIRDTVNKSSRIVMDAVAAYNVTEEKSYVKGLQNTWNAWLKLEVRLHEEFKPDFKEIQNISETSLFKELSRKDEQAGWFQATDSLFDSEEFRLSDFHEKNDLMSTFYGKHLIPPELTGTHYGAVLIAYVNKEYEQEEDDMAVMLLDGIAGMYWVHLADQIDEDLKKYHEQTSALRLSDAEYSAVKEDVIELTQRLDEANAISARIRSQIDPTWQNLGAVAEVFRLYLDENAKKIKYHKEEGTLEGAETGETNEDSWIALEEETAHDGHPIRKEEKCESGSSAHLIKTVFKKNSICKQDRYKDLKEYIWTQFSSERDKDAKDRQKIFKALLGRRTGEIQVIQLMWGLIVALKEREGSPPFIYHGESVSTLIQKMKSCPTFMLDKKCPLVKDTHNMSFLDVIHELIVFILKGGEQQKKVDLHSVLVYLDLKDNEQAESGNGGSILVIFFCEAVFGDRPEQLFISRPRDEREKHDTGRVVNRLCEATTFQIKYEPSPLIRNHNDEEVKNWIGEESDPRDYQFTKDYFENKPSGCFLKAMSPGCVISTGEATTVIALKLDIE